MTNKEAWIRFAAAALSSGYLHATDAAKVADRMLGELEQRSSDLDDYDRVYENDLLDAAPDDSGLL